MRTPVRTSPVCGCECSHKEQRNIDEELQESGVRMICPPVRVASPVHQPAIDELCVDTHGFTSKAYRACAARCIAELLAATANRAARDFTESLASERWFTLRDPALLVSGRDCRRERSGGIRGPSALEFVGEGR